MPAAQSNAAAAASSVKNNKQNVRKKRTAVSCDRCKNRKTKCVDPVPGPCHYCASINAPCKTDLNRRKKRPYYHVSEEEYRCMKVILRHYLPDLEFNLPSLKALCQRLEGLDDTDAGELSSQIPSLAGTPSAETTPCEDTLDADFGHNRAVEPSGCRAASQEQEEREDVATTANGDDSGDEEDPSFREFQLLQERLGCLMIDSRGNYRHVGTDSSIGFNAAVRMIREPGHGSGPGLLNEHPPASSDGPADVIIQPLTTTSLPPATPESSVGIGSIPNDGCRTGSQSHAFLPPIEEASASIQRYFDDVHCLYWLFSTEHFHERVHETYMTDGILAGASWLCCLYSIFAIGSAGGRGSGLTSHNQTAKSASEYLVMAKALVAQVIDDADVDSVRALTLLALALQTECYTNTAYLYIGNAVRTAYSLGMHVDKAAPPSRGRLERERNRRIWWTLYLLDFELAHRYGNPCAIADRQHDDVQVQMPSEQILSPGPTTPPTYLHSASTLCAISRRIRSTLHHHRKHSSPNRHHHRADHHGPIRRSEHTIRGLLSALQSWRARLPPHLSALSHTAPAHRRAVGVLHARYWAAVVLATRPFLLCKAWQALRSKRPSPQHHHRQQMSQCGASDQSDNGGGWHQRASACRCSRSGVTGARCRRRCCCCCSCRLCRQVQGDGGSQDGIETDGDAARDRRQQTVAELSMTCVAAAEEGLSIMKAMARDAGSGENLSTPSSSSLSSLVNFDCSYLLELVQVFRLALVLEELDDDRNAVRRRETASAAFTFPPLTPSQCGGLAELEELDDCTYSGTGTEARWQKERTAAASKKETRMRQIKEALAIMEGMEQVGWTAKALPELSAQLQEGGILDGGHSAGPGFADLAPPLGLEEMMTEAMAGQSSVECCRTLDYGSGCAFGSADSMELDDDLGALFEDVLGDHVPTLGRASALGDTYGSESFLDIGFSSQG